MYIKAIKHIRRLRGGSQAQLMAADDGHEHVVKFQGNPQTTRVLANDYLAVRPNGRIERTRAGHHLCRCRDHSGNSKSRSMKSAASHGLQRKHTAAFIDFGYCFNAGEWSFPDSPLRGAYARQEVYAHIASWGDFEPWLSRIERCSKAILQSIARDISIEWYGEPNDLDCLLDSLFERRRAFAVRSMISESHTEIRFLIGSWVR